MLLVQICQIIIIVFDQQAEKIYTGNYIQENFESSEWESTTNMFFAFPFAQITKEKLHYSAFTMFKN